MKNYFMSRIFQSQFSSPGFQWKARHPKQTEPSQVEPSRAESSTSSVAFAKPTTGMFFTTLMGMEDSHGSSDSTVKKLSEALEAVVGEASIGLLPDSQ